MISAVIVTYNRLSLLKECLLAVHNQTRKLDQVIVVNNGSTDGTTEWLKSKTDIYIINQENCGGAGGFNTGVKFAYENGADWVWVMDDDVKAEKNCLEELLKYSHVSLCLHPARICSDGVDYIWGEFLDLKNYKKYVLSDFEVKNKDIYFVNVGCFEGMLINSKIIAKIGFPDTRFFIAGDDTIYGYLANQFTNVCCIKTAKMIRAKKSTDQFVSPMYFYYLYRNFHLYEEYNNKLTGEGFSRITKFKYVLTGIVVIAKLIIKPYTFINKINVVKAILKAFFHSKLKMTNSTYN